LRRKDVFHSNRRIFLGEFIKLVEGLHRFFAYPFGWKVKEVEADLTLLEENWNRLTRTFDSDEKSQAEVCIDSTKEVIQNCTSYIEAESRVKVARHQIELAVNKTNRHRSEVSSLVNRIIMNYNAEAIEAPVNLD
jgi:hypothetical protein